MNTNLSVKIETSNLDLNPCPVNPAWVLEGQPVARVRVLSNSADNAASMIVWDCTAGKFNWFYSIDESFYVIEGSAILKIPEGKTRTITVGDTVFFPAGSQAEWTVDRYIRKVAFCRSTLPIPVAFAIRALRAVIRKVSRLSGKAATPQMFGN